MKIYMEDCELNKLNNKLFSEKLSNLDGLRLVTEELKQIRTYSIQSTNLDFVNSLLKQSDGFEENNNLKFISSQLQLYNNKRPAYGPEFLIFCSLFFNCSPSAYQFMRTSGYVKLPCFSTLRRFNSFLGLSAKNEDFLKYISKKIQYLSENDIVVSLMIDEIHIKTAFDYKGGSIVGSAYNSEVAANSAFVFMIHSVKSKYQDVVHIMTVKTFTAENLNEFIVKVNKGLHCIDFKVISVVTDNNSINKKAMSMLLKPPKPSIVYPNPADSSPLFFLIDSVHILKCVRNNWLNQKSLDRLMTYPAFDSDSNESKIAAFSTIQKLHLMESDSLLQFTNNISAKALAPSSMERQNVYLATM